MKLKTLLISLFLLAYLCSDVFSQTMISGKSKSKSMSFTREYKRGYPPVLYIDLNFSDDNSNGFLEANEKAILQLKIKNIGDGPAQGLKVKVKDLNPDKEFIISGEKEISFVQPGNSVNVSIPITAGFDVKSAEHNLEINVTEHFGYDMDPAYLVLNSLEFQKAKLVFSGMEIVDAGQGSIISDGQLQAGEMVKAKIVIQNIGQNIATNTSYKVYSTDPNIYIDKGTGNLGDLAIGEIKELWVDISPNKRVVSTEKLPIYIDLTETKGKGNLQAFQLPVALDQKPPRTEILQVKADIEGLRQKVARFEYTSNKFTTNVGNIIDIQQVAPSKTNRPNSVAVIFGIEQYDNLAPAPYTENDAEIMKKYFKYRLGVQHVVVYKSNEAKGFIFDDVFNPDYGGLQKAILKGQTDLFIFYSGHGLPNKIGDQVYLFPSDGKVERIETQGYNLDKFYKNLEDLGARTTTVFLDACFSGVSKASEKIQSENLVSMKGVKIKPKYMQPWATNNSFVVFNSSSGEETSMAFDPSQTGLFTYFLCAGMQGKADTNSDNKITASELSNYVKNNVCATSKKIRGLQTPEFHGNGDMVLIEY